MKKMVAVLLLILASMLCGIMTVSVLADKNYEDHKQEIYGHSEAPENGIAKEEPRLRFKDV